MLKLLQRLTSWLKPDDTHPPDYPNETNDAAPPPEDWHRSRITGARWSGR